MKEQEIIDWFNNYYNNCYYVNHTDYPESVFMFYDVNYVRQQKLAKLDGKNYVEKNDITGVCLFEQDWKNKYFRCNYMLIWCYLKDNYSYNYDNNKTFIKERLEDLTKMNVLLPEPLAWLYINPLEDHSKMNILTPNCTLGNRIDMVEHSKMNIITRFTT